MFSLTISHITSLVFFAVGLVLLVLGCLVSRRAEARYNRVLVRYNDYRVDKWFLRKIDRATDIGVTGVLMTAVSFLIFIIC